jgi:hypothetical protein
LFSWIKALAKLYERKVSGMNHDELMKRLPVTLDRLEGKAKTPRAKVKRAEQLGEDIDTLQAFAEYALRNAVMQGEFWGRGFNSAGVEATPEVGSPLPMSLDASDETQVFAHLRKVIGTGLPEPARKLPPERTPAEDAPREVTHYIETTGEAPRADVVIPTPDNPRNFAEWIPLLMWAIPKIGQLIKKWRDK